MSTTSRWEDASRGLSFTDWSIHALAEGLKRESRRPVVGAGPDAPPVYDGDSRSWYADGGTWSARCRAGVAGELVWTREAWWDFGAYAKPTGGEKQGPWAGLGADGLLRPHYGRTPPPVFRDAAGSTWDAKENALRRRAGEAHWRLRRDWFLPRHFSRMLLRLEWVRCERLQALTEESARWEGVGHRFAETLPAAQRPAFEAALRQGRRVAFGWLWDSLHGQDAWKANGWVWALGLSVEKVRWVETP